MFYRLLSLLVFGLLLAGQPLMAQSAQEQSSGEKFLSLFKKKEVEKDVAAADQDLKSQHKDAKKDVRAYKKERKAAEAREEAARARADVIKAQRRAERKESKAEKADGRAVKARDKVDGNAKPKEDIFGGLFKKKQ